jgi:hypothetical protein
VSQWPFVIAAYSAAILLTVGLVAWAYTSMRRAEAAADEIGRK